MGDETSRSSLHDSSAPLLRRLDLVPKVGIAPTSPPLQGGANLSQLLRGTMWFDFTGLDVRNKPRRMKHNRHFSRRSDSNDSIRFVALAKEQLALVTENGFHGFPFVNG